MGTVPAIIAAEIAEALIESENTVGGAFVNLHVVESAFAESEIMLTEQAEIIEQLWVDTEAEVAGQVSAAAFHLIAEGILQTEVFLAEAESFVIAESHRAAPALPEEVLIEAVVVEDQLITIEDNIAGIGIT